MNSELQKELKNQTKEFRKLIGEYCLLESVAAQNRMMQETAEWVEKLFINSGFETKQLNIEGAPNYVYAEQKGRSDFTLLLYNHYDVQPEDPVDLWESPPFELTEREGKLYARGIADNKAELISRICAIRAIKAAKGTLPITLKWIVEGEEEIGSPHFGDMTKQFSELLKADAAIWEGTGFDENGRTQLILGFRGGLFVEYEVESMKRDAHSGSASVLPSSAWRLIKALSSLKDEKGNIIIPGFFDDVRAPSEAEKEALRDAVNLELEEKILETYGLDAFTDNKRGYELELQVYQPTANVAGILSGYTEEGVKTVLPAKAMAKMDFRLVPEQIPDDIFGKLKVHLKAQGFEDVKITKLAGAEPVVTPIADPFVHRMKQISKDFTGQEAEIIPLTGGTLPLLEAMKKNVGVLGVSSTGNLLYYGSSVHSTNENIRIEDIEKAISFNAFMFEELGKG